MIAIKLILRIYLLCIIFLFFQCSENKKDDNSLDKVQIYSKEKNSLVINHDSLSSPNDCRIMLFDSRNKQLLYSLNQLSNSIDLYSFEGFLLNRLVLENEGPNGVGKISNFFVYSSDSIFVLSTTKYLASLINSKGKVLNRYSYLFNKNGKEVLGEGLISYGNFSNQMYVKDNFLYVGATPFDDPTMRRFYDNGKSCLTINLKNGNPSFLTFLPKNWVQKYDDGFALTGIQTELGQAYNGSKNKCIISYRTDNSLYEIDINSHVTKAHIAKSKFFDGIQWYKKSLAIKHDINDEFDYVIKQPNYSAIYFDEYRNYYLRFVAHPNKEKKDELDGREWFLYSIIILDDKFNKIGETMLDERYESSNVLITKKGIYLNRYEKDEQHTYYTLFDYKIEK